MFDVFDQRTGITIVTVPRVVAIAIVKGARKKGRHLDYIEKGEGWL